MPDGSATRTSWTRTARRAAAQRYAQGGAARRRSGTFNTDTVYLFGEHFVVKPPGAGRFAAHRRRAPARGGAGGGALAIVSAWVAPTTLTPPTAGCSCCLGTPPGARPLQAPAPRLSWLGRAAACVRPPRARATRSSSPRRCCARRPNACAPTAARAARYCSPRSRAARPLHLALLEEAAARRRRFSYLTSLTTRTRAHPLMARPPDDVCSAGGTWMKNIQSDGVLGSRPIMDIL